MTTPPKRRTYPENPAVPVAPSPAASPASSPSTYPGPQVVIDLQTFVRPPPPSTPSGPPPNAISRTYGLLAQHEITEDDLLSRIQTLENAKQVPELIERATCKRQLAEKKSSNPSLMTPLLTSAHEDLLKASELAQNYTFCNEIKNSWLKQIAFVQTTLRTLAEQNHITLPEPSPLELPLKAVKLDEFARVRRIAARIFAVFTLAFSAGVAIHYFVRRYRL